MKLETKISRIINLIEILGIYLLYARSKRRTRHPGNSRRNNRSMQQLTDEDLWWFIYHANDIGVWNKWTIYPLSLQLGIDPVEYHFTAKRSSVQSQSSNVDWIDRKQNLQNHAKSNGNFQSKLLTNHRHHHCRIGRISHSYSAIKQITIISIIKMKKL